MVVKKGQISVEYLIIVGFVVTIVIAILGIALFYTSGVRDQIKSNQLDAFASKVTSNAEVVFYRGEPSRTTITAYLPEGVDHVWINKEPGLDDYSIVFNFTSYGGYNLVAYSSNVPINITGEISPNEGVKRLLIVAKIDAVYIIQQ